MKRDHILEKVNENGIYLHDKLMKALGNQRHVGEIRHIGLINAIELVENKETKKLLIRKAYRLAYLPESYEYGTGSSTDGRHYLF